MGLSNYIYFVNLLHTHTIDDHSRVHLFAEPGIPYSDYINASLIDVSQNLVFLFSYIQATAVFSQTD